MKMYPQLFSIVITASLLSLSGVATNSTIAPLLAATPMASPSVQSTVLDYARMGVGGVRLGLSEPDVRQKLGKPLRVKEQTWGCCGPVRTLTYPQLTVLIAFDSVQELRTQSPRLATIDGLRVGDRRSQVIKTYGQPSRTRREGSRTYLSYDDQHQSSFITFAMVGDRVQEIHCHSLLD